MAAGGLAMRGTGLARFMGILSLVAMVLTPIVTAAIFLLPHLNDGVALTAAWNGIAATEIAESPFSARVVACLIALIPTAFSTYALWALGCLFFLYARGEVFTNAPLHRLRTVARALLASVLADLLLNPAITLALTWYKGPGRRTITLALGDHEIATLFIAGAVFVIASVMAEARRVADENAGFV